MNEVKCKSESGSQLLMCSIVIHSRIARTVSLSSIHLFLYIFFFHFPPFIVSTKPGIIFLQPVPFLSNIKQFIFPHIFIFIKFLLITSFYKTNFIIFSFHGIFSILQKVKFCGVYCFLALKYLELFESYWLQVSEVYIYSCNYWSVMLP